MSPVDLRWIIESLAVSQPEVDESICRWWPASCERDERKHWVDWLADHERRGTTSAAVIWKHIQSPPMLIWLMAASGVDPDVINDAADAASNSRHRSSQCRILRARVSWQLVRRNLLRSPRT
jgi:hypothetical protein